MEQSDAFFDDCVASMKEAEEVMARVAGEMSVHHCSSQLGLVA